MRGTSRGWSAWMWPDGNFASTGELGWTPLTEGQKEQQAGDTRQHSNRDAVPGIIPKTNLGMAAGGFHHNDIGDGSHDSEVAGKGCGQGHHFPHQLGLGKV